MRALAVLVVVIFHLWPKALTGGFVGVDVFFVISGYLITSHIVRDSSQGAGRVLRFWARRIRRLMPASFLVIATTALAVLIAVPAFLKRDWLVEVVASTAYSENWLLARKSVDYMAEGAAASPTQHFWSLAVEEQFYIVWPILILGATLLFKKAGKKATFALIALITIVSLGYSIYLTRADASVAYFSTPVRAWEFGAGSLLAFVSFKINAMTSRVVALVGLSLIGGSAVIFNSALPFPGAFALVPVIGTALVIWSRVETGRLHQAFALKPIAWLGSRSYSIYLWHWPLLILLPYFIHQQLTWPTKLAVFAATLVLANLTTKYVEQPFIAGGRWSQLLPRKVFATLALASIVLGGGSLIGVATNNARISQELAAGVSTVDSFPDDFGYLPGCEDIPFAQTEPQICELGDRSSKVRVAAVGDSHLGAYVASLDALARKNKWSLDVIWKPACAYSIASRSQRASRVSACKTWNAKVTEHLIANPFDVVITTAKSGVTWQRAADEDNNLVAVNGFEQAWAGLIEAKSSVLVIRDNPRARGDLASCIAITGAKECSLPRDEALKDDPQVAAVEAMGLLQVQLLDFTDTYCDATECKPLIDGKFVYRDDQHLTGAFAGTLMSVFETAIYESLSTKLR